MARMEWIRNFDPDNHTGRIEYEYSGDKPVYIGYAPIAGASEFDTGWIVQKYIYEGDNVIDVITAGGNDVSWATRADAEQFKKPAVRLSGIHPISVRSAGINPVQHKRGSAVGTLNIRALSPIEVAALKIKTGSVQGGIAVRQLRVKGFPNEIAAKYGSFAFMQQVGLRGSVAGYAVNFIALDPKPISVVGFVTGEVITP